MTSAKSPQSPYEILEELYKNPKYSILSKSKFTQKVRQLHPEIKRKDIEDFISSQNYNKHSPLVHSKATIKSWRSPTHFKQICSFLMNMLLTTRNMVHF
jgi:hypothetical protein